MQNLQWYPGHMAKTRRMIEENLKMIDVVVEILDARIPKSGRNPAFDDILKNKPRLLVMNKADLADQRATDRWIAAYKNQGIRVIPISCQTGQGVNRVIPEARALVSDILEKAAEKGRNRPLRIMMAGIPNVGKSSLINKLCKKAAAKTGDRPGVTRAKQWVRIMDGVEMMDTPGMLPPKLEDQNAAVRLAFTGGIRDEIMETELLAYELLDYLRDSYPTELCARYKITDDISQMRGHELLELVGKKRGCVISGGEIDTERAANILLDEFRAAKIGRITLE